MISILAVTGGIALADDSSMSGIGGSMAIMHSNPTIQMVSEVVTITSLPKGHVDATFWMKNTGPATDATIGFPGYGYNDSPLLTNFRSQVDGSPVNVTMVKTKPVGDGEEQRIWFVKKVHFAANQTHVIRDEYVGGGGDDSMANEWFSYILHTGSSWKSIIEHATVTADLTGLSPYTVTQIYPAGFARHGSTVTWTFQNIKPTGNNDIRIQYYPAFLNVTINGAPLLSASQTPPDWRAHDDWGSAVSIRQGDDVRLSGRTAASWLSASLVVVKPNKVLRIIRGRRWVQITLGSRYLETSAGAKIAMPGPSVLGNGSPMFGNATDRYVMAYLTPIVTGLGGKAVMTGDTMAVSLPPMKAK